MTKFVFAVARVSKKTTHLIMLEHDNQNEKHPLQTILEHTQALSQQLSR